MSTNAAEPTETVVVTTPIPETQLEIALLRLSREAQPIDPQAPVARFNSAL